MSTTKLKERLLSQERRDSEYFPVSVDVCAAFLRKASSISCKGLEVTLLDGVVNEATIFSFVLLLFFWYFSHDHLI